MGNATINVAKLKGKIMEKYPTFSAFADEVGISKQYLNIIFKGNCNFTYNVLQGIVDALGLTPDEIKMIFFTNESY